MKSHAENLAKAAEMMLSPPLMVEKSATYAHWLEEWARTFPRSQMLVVHTDDLTTQPQRVMGEVFDLLGLPHVDVGAKTRFCVQGKAGVMDIIRRKDAAETFIANASHSLGDCGGSDARGLPPGMVRDTAGVLQHEIDPLLAARLMRFFKPSIERLYRFLGRDLGWR
mgnify:FL=1